MTEWLQGSLLDLDEPTGLGDVTAVRRTVLTADAWIDVLPGWLRGADACSAAGRRRAVARERRQMYDRIVDVPRLLKFYGEGEPLPAPGADRGDAPR